MTTLLLEALFAMGATLALATMALTARRYGLSALALRQAMRDVGEIQHVFIKVTEITVAREPSILRPDFTRRAAVPATGYGLRAAA